METSENSSASAELTSTQGSAPTTEGTGDVTQSPAGDSVPSSSSDATLRASSTKTPQDDPISSTSDSVGSFHFADERDPTAKDLVSDTDFFSSDLNIESITTEKISEDVEDIANDLENLLGETNNDFIISVSPIKEDNVSTRSKLGESESKESLSSNKEELDIKKEDGCLKLSSEGSSTENIDSTEGTVKLVETSSEDKVVDIKVAEDQSPTENDEIEPRISLQHTANDTSIKTDDHSQLSDVSESRTEDAETSIPPTKIEPEKIIEPTEVLPDKASCDNKEISRDTQKDDTSKPVQTNAEIDSQENIPEFKKEAKVEGTHPEDAPSASSTSNGQSDENQITEKEDISEHNSTIPQQDTEQSKTETKEESQTDKTPDLKEKKPEAKEQENEGSKSNGNLQDTIDDEPNETDCKSKQSVVETKNQHSHIQEASKVSETVSDVPDGVEVETKKTSATDEKQVDDVQPSASNGTENDALGEEEQVLSTTSSQKDTEINEVPQSTEGGDPIEEKKQEVPQTADAPVPTESSIPAGVTKSEIPQTNDPPSTEDACETTSSNSTIPTTKDAKIENNDCASPEMPQVNPVDLTKEKEPSPNDTVDSEPPTCQEDQVQGDTKTEEDEVSSTISADVDITPSNEDQPNENKSKTKSAEDTVDAVLETLPSIDEDSKKEEVESNDDVPSAEMISKTDTVPEKETILEKEIVSDKEIVSEKETIIEKETIADEESISKKEIISSKTIVKNHQKPSRHNTPKEQSSEAEMSKEEPIKEEVKIESTDPVTSPPLDNPMNNIENPVSNVLEPDKRNVEDEKSTVVVPIDQDPSQRITENIDMSDEVTTTSTGHETANSDTSDKNDISAETKNKCEMTISSIIEEAIQDEHESSSSDIISKVPQEATDDNPVVVSTIENVSEVAEVLDNVNNQVVAEQIGDVVSQKAQDDCEGTDAARHSTEQEENPPQKEDVGDTSCPESTTVHNHENQQGNDGPSEEVNNENDEQELVVEAPNSELTGITNEIENENSESAQTEENSELVLEGEKFDVQKSPETFTGKGECEQNTHTETEAILPTPEALTVVPDSVDEGNIAAMAISEPPGSDYYHIEDEVESSADQTMIKRQEPAENIDRVVVKETNSLHELPTDSQPIEKIKKNEKFSKEVLPSSEKGSVMIDEDPPIIENVSDPPPVEVKNLEQSKEQNPTTIKDKPVEDISENKNPHTSPDLEKIALKTLDVHENPGTEKKSSSEEKSKQSSKHKAEAPKLETTSQNSESPKKVSKTRASADVDTCGVVDQSKKQQLGCQIEPLVIDVDSPIEVSDDCEVLSPQYSSKMSTKELLKITITKHKTDSPKEEDSILKIYDPKEDKKNQKVKESIPKLIIKPVVRSQSPPSDEPEQAIPKLLIRNMSPNRPCSPKVSKTQKTESCSTLKVTIKPVAKPDENPSKSSPKLNIKPIVKTDEDTFTPKITIKPIVKPEEEVSHNPKITIKPIVKPEEETSSNPRITIKPIPKPEETTAEPPSPRITIKPLVRPDEEVLKEEERSHSPRVIIKPIKGDDPKISVEEMVHSPRITIKPIKPPDEEESSPKITIKPLIKPQEEDRHEKKEGSPKIKIKPIVKPPEEQPELIDFEEQIKQERIVLKINTKESRKREASEEIEKLAKIKLKFSKEGGGRAHIVSDQKLKRALEEPHNVDKRQKVETVDLSSSPESKEIIEIKDDSNPAYEDPIESIPTFQINVQKTVTVQNNPNPAPANPAPRKRGRPRKIPLVVREEFKDPKEEEPEPVPVPVSEETGRPKRSCRGPSVCTTLGIKPRKPRGGGATGTRGRGRGRGSRGGSRGSTRQQRVTARQKLLEEEEAVAAAASRARKLVVDEIIEIPDDDPKEEERPPQPLPQTQPDVTDVRAPTPPAVVVVEAIVAESATESVPDNVPSEGGSDVVLIEEETRMSADIHSSRAQTPAKHVLAVVDIEDTQSSVQSTATTESVKVVRKGSRLEVHQEPECDIISPEQLAEYYWGGSGPYMLQEQVAQFLGIKSFKRKYPGIQRRPVDMQERDFIRESCLASEAMCDMGLTAVASADILDIMYSDFQHKYEEYCKHQRDRHTKDIINKQKALNLAASQEKSKHDLTQQAVQSAAAWNITLNKSRREERRACMDLQTFTVNYPRGKYKSPEKAKVGSYPIALVPGQYTDNYREFSPNEIYNLPLNTMMNQTLSIVRDDDSQSDGSGSDSDTTTSDSDSSSSDSTDEDCNLCTSQLNPKKIVAN